MLKKEEFLLTLIDNILPYWSDSRIIDYQYGGFYGRISGKDNPDLLAEKGAIMNARILWSFSASARFLSEKGILNDPSLDIKLKDKVLKSQQISLLMAKRAKDFFTSSFIDNQYGGVYWSLDHKGQPLNTKKQFYAISFAIYALSEYYMTDPDPAVLECAVNLYRTIEKYSYDGDIDGYIEATTREWHPIEDMRLSDKDLNSLLSMNTHLHILEAYTNLHRIWKDKELENRLKNLILIHLDKIYDHLTHHARLFFDKSWKPQGETISYGHDIEASWLILEAALELNDRELIERVEKAGKKIAIASLEGFSSKNYMIYDKLDDGSQDKDAHWWVQAECMVGLLYLSTYHKVLDALSIATKNWEFIKENLIDNKNGEWHWSIKADGTVNLIDDKAGFWKCPYHNSRMCIKIYKLLAL